MPDHLLNQLLSAGSRAFRRETRQHISRVVDDTVTLDPEGSTVLLLPELPVTAVTSLTINGVAVDVAGLWSEKGIIRRSAAFPRTFRSVQVTYTHGYDPIPEDVAEAVVDYVITRGLSTPGTPGGQVTTGPFTVQQPRAGATELWVETVKAYRR